MLTLFPLENHVRVTKMQEHFNRPTQPNLRVGERANFSTQGVKYNSFKCRDEACHFGLCCICSNLQSVFCQPACKPACNHCSFWWAFFKSICVSPIDGYNTRHFANTVQITLFIKQTLYLPTFSAI